MLIYPTTVINQETATSANPILKTRLVLSRKGIGRGLSFPSRNYGRGKCAVGLPLSRHTDKAGAHLIYVPRQEITVDDPNDQNIDRVALTDQIRALDKTRFRRKFGRVSPRAVTSILLGLDYLFGSAPLPVPTPPVVAASTPTPVSSAMPPATK